MYVQVGFFLRGLKDQKLMLLTVLKLFLCIIYRDFKTEIIDDTGIEQRNTYLAHPVGRSLVVRFIKVSEVL